MDEIGSPNSKNTAIRFGPDNCKIFVGGIPPDAEATVLEEEFHKKWGDVVHVYYKGPGSGWATVQFSNQSKRDEIVKSKIKHKILNKIVDVKQYVRPTRNNPTDMMMETLSLTRNTSRSRSSSNSIGIRNASPSPARIPGQSGALPKKSNEHATSSTAIAAVIVAYNFKFKFGSLRTADRGNGIFHLDAIYICQHHGNTCQEKECPFVISYHKINSAEEFFKYFPLGTQVNVEIESIALPFFEFKFIAKLLWHSLSVRGSLMRLLPFEAISEQAKTFIGIKKEFYQSPYQSLDGTQSKSQGSTMSLSTELYVIGQIADFLQKTFRIEGSDDQVLNLARVLTNTINDPFVETVHPHLISMFMDEHEIKVQESRQHIFALYLTRRHSLVAYIRQNDHKRPSRLAEKLKDYKGSRDNNSILLKSSLGKSDPMQTKQITTSKVNDRTAVDGNYKNTGTMPKKPLIVESSNIKMRKSMINLPSNVSEDFNGASNASDRNAQDEQVTVDVGDESDGEAIVNHKGTKFSTETSNNETATEESDSDESNHDEEIFETLGQDFSRVTLNTIKSYSKASEQKFGLENWLDLDLNNPRNADLVDKFRDIAKWIRETWKNEPRVFDNHASTEIKVIMQVFREGPDLQQLCSQFCSCKEGVSVALGKLAKTVFERTQGKEFMISVDAVVKNIFKFCMSRLVHSVPPKRLDLITRLMSSVQFRGDSSEFNIRGVVIHMFNDFFGVIQTPLGRVLFERNIFYAPSISQLQAINERRHLLLSEEDISWIKIKAEVPVGSLVRLNLTQSMVKVSKRTKVGYFYAKKVWFDIMGAEPQTGSLLPGGMTYWNDVMKNFELIVKNNHKVLGKKEARENESDYADAIDKALIMHYNSRVSATSSVGPFSPQKILKVYRPFIKYCTETQKDLNIRRLLASCQILLDHGITLEDLKKDLCGAMQIGASEVFEESVEMLLINADPNLLVGLFKPLNVAHLLKDYFQSCPEFRHEINEGQRAYEGRDDRTKLDMAVQFASQNLVIARELSGDFKFDEALEALSKLEDDDESDDSNKESQENDADDSIPSDEEQITIIDRERTRSNEEVSEINQLCEKVEEKPDENRSKSVDEPKMAELKLLSNDLAAARSDLENFKKKKLIEEKDFAKLKSELLTNSGKEHAKDYNKLNSRMEANEKALSNFSQRLTKLEKEFTRRMSLINMEGKNYKAELESIKTTVERLEQNQTMFSEKSMALVPGVSSSGGAVAPPVSQNNRVKIQASEGGKVYGIPLNENGEVDCRHVKVIKPNVNALVYEVEGVSCLCFPSNDFFLPPNDGWGERIYLALGENPPPPPPPMAGFLPPSSGLAPTVASFPNIANFQGIRQRWN